MRSYLLAALCIALTLVPAAGWAIQLPATSATLAPATLDDGTQIKFTYTDKGQLGELPAPIAVIFARGMAVIDSAGQAYSFEYSVVSPNTVELLTYPAGNPAQSDKDLLTFETPTTGRFENLGSSKAKGTFELILSRGARPSRSQNANARRQRESRQPQSETLEEHRQRALQSLGMSPQVAPQVSFDIPDSLNGKVIQMFAAKGTAFSSEGSDRQLLITSDHEFEAYSIDGKPLDREGEVRCTYEYAVKDKASATFRITFHFAGAEEKVISHVLAFSTATEGTFSGGARGKFRIREAKDVVSQAVDPLATPSTFAIYTTPIKGPCWYPETWRGLAEASNMQAAGFDRNLAAIAVGNTGVVFFGLQFNSFDTHMAGLTKSEAKWTKAALVLASEVKSLSTALKESLTNRSEAHKKLAVFEFCKLELISSDGRQMLVVTPRTSLPFQPSGFSRPVETEHQMQFTPTEVQGLIELIDKNYK